MVQYVALVDLNLNFVKQRVVDDVILIFVCKIRSRIAISAWSVQKIGDELRMRFEVAT